ncbi:hypothetical protein D3C76_1487260 [compost metagenome]
MLDRIDTEVIDRVAAGRLGLLNPVGLPFDNLFAYGRIFRFEVGKTGYSVLDNGIFIAIPQHSGEHLAFSLRRKVA